MSNTITSADPSSTLRTVYDSAYLSPWPMAFASLGSLYAGFSQHFKPILLQQTEIKPGKESNVLKPSKVLKMKVNCSLPYNMIFALGQVGGAAMILDDDIRDGVGLGFITSTLYVMCNAGFVKNMFIYSRKAALGLYAFNLVNATGYGYRYVTNDFNALAA